MANIFNGHRYKLDTPGASPISTLAHYVKSLTWTGTGMTSGITTCLITDPVNGQYLMYSIATGVTVVEFRRLGEWWHNGFTLTTLDSGLVTIALR